MCSRIPERLRLPSQLLPLAHAASPRQLTFTRLFNSFDQARWEGREVTLARGSHSGGGARPDGI